MANLFSEIGLIGVTSLFLPKSNTIGSVTIDTTLEESYDDTLEITEHPVEAGAAITDHSFKRPMELVLTCGWSDSSPSGLLGAASGLIGTQATNALATVIPVGAIAGAINTVSSLFGNPGAGNSGSFTGGSMIASDYVAGIYSSLLRLQESRQTIVVTSGFRKYNSMLLQSIRVRRDQRTQYVLNVTAVLKQIIIVSTQTATLPTPAAQAFPASTADIVQAGQQALQKATPSLIATYPPQ